MGIFPLSFDILGPGHGKTPVPVPETSVFHIRYQMFFYPTRVLLTP